MKKTAITAARHVLCAAAAVLSLAAAAQEPADYVDPFIGTNGMGHTFPGACVPFGAVQLSPDTDTIPHNVRESTRNAPTSIVPATVTATRPSSASATPT